MVHSHLFFAGVIFSDFVYVYRCLYIHISFREVLE